MEDRFSIEGRLGIGLSGDSLGGVHSEIDERLGVYGLDHRPLNDDVTVYGALGFSMGEGTASTDEGSASDDDGGLSYGSGVDLRLTPTTDLNLEVMQYLDPSDFDISALAIGARSAFQ